MILDPADPLAMEAVATIAAGDVAKLEALLQEHPGLASARIGDARPLGATQSLLHVVAEGPTRVPNGAALVRVLAAAGADPNARFTGPHTETPLHWAASNDNVEVLDALLDAGADIDATGAVISGGTPLADARLFQKWHAARRLIERGATTSLSEAASLGLMDRIERLFARTPAPDAGEVDRAFWNACDGGRLDAARYLLERGANLNFIPHWEYLTPLDAAIRANAEDVTAWLSSVGARGAGPQPPKPGG